MLYLDSIVSMAVKLKEEKMTEQYSLVRELVRGRLESRTRLYYLFGYLYDFVFYRARRLRVYLLNGFEKNKGGALTTIFVGSEAEAYEFCSLVYSEICRMLLLGEILPSKIKSIEEYSKGLSNLLIARSTASNALSFQKRGYFVLPTVSFRLDLRVSTDDLLRRMSRRRRRDIGKIENLDYSHRICRRDSESFDYFYQEMYRPFVEQRFGKAATFRSYSMSRAIYQNNGGIIFVQADGKPVAGILFQRRGKTLFALSFGRCNSREAYNLSGQAALFYLIEWAKSNGIECLDYGLCSPFFKDGIFSYKKQWGMAICSRPECSVYALKLSSIDETYLSFLKENPFVVLDGRKLKGIVFTDYIPTSQETKQILSEYSLLGLESIVLVACCKKSVDAGSPTKTLATCKDSRIFNCLSDFCFLTSSKGYSTEVFELTNLPRKCKTQ